MKKPNYFVFALAIGMIIFAIVAGIAMFNDNSQPVTAPQENNQDEKNNDTNKPINIPQLSEERADAATMVLISAPPLSPPDHVGRWNPELGQESCLMCHGQPDATGAREIPIDHFTDQDRSKGIFGARNQCITCHGLDTGETKRGFNRD